MRVMSGISSAKFFNDPGDDAKKMREAFAASKFAVIRAQNDRRCYQLSLVAPGEEFPDFKLKMDGEVLDFEVSEALDPADRRGEKYREVAERDKQGMKPKAELFDPDDEIERAKKHIERTIVGKKKKKYSVNPNLLVLVQFPLFDEEDLPTSWMFQSLSTFGSDFKSLWLLWGNGVVQIAPTKLAMWELKGR